MVACKSFAGYCAAYGYRAVVYCVAVPVLFADADCVSCIGQMVCLGVLLPEGFWCADAQKVKTFLIICYAVACA